MLKTFTSVPGANDVASTAVVLLNRTEEPRSADTPVDMALNHGTYCSEHCVEVLRPYDSRTALRIYPLPDNQDLRNAVASSIGVDPARSLANGSGPLLKLAIPFVIERKIKSSARRILQHLIFRNAYPLNTPRFTYSKVPSGAIKHQLEVNLLPLRPEDGFRMDLPALRAQLRRRDGAVYLSSPNNPTGNVLLSAAELEPLLADHPGSVFFLDEAYLEYARDGVRPDLIPLVRRFPNLVLLRSFSFAYGLAAARVGYLVTDPGLVKALETKVTPHLVGQYPAELVMASLRDKAHLPFVREQNARERQGLKSTRCGPSAGWRPSTPRRTSSSAASPTAAPAGRCTTRSSRAG